MEGVLLLNKPAGMTSHDCVARMRRLARTKKVGHTGTLDPDVTGVLPICLGRATKIVEYLTAASKTYEAEITVGVSTTTEDASGEVVDRKPVDIVTDEDVQNVLQSMLGVNEQVPPMYSAVKINGKKLYEYARAGIEVDRPSRMITIHELDLLGNVINKNDLATFRIRVTCSKGTYVRTLAVMIGEKLGYPAHMSHLVRTKSGEFELTDCLTFEEVENAIENNNLQKSLLSIGEALKDLPKLTIHDTLAEKVKNGAVLELPAQFDKMEAGDPIAVYGENGACLAIYSKHPTKPHLMKPTKVLANET